MFCPAGSRSVQLGGCVVVCCFCCVVVCCFCCVLTITRALNVVRAGGKARGHFTNASANEEEDEEDVGAAHPRDADASHHHRHHPSQQQPQTSDENHHSSNTSRRLHGTRWCSRRVHGTRWCAPHGLPAKGRIPGGPSRHGFGLSVIFCYLSIVF